MYTCMCKRMYIQFKHTLHSITYMYVDTFAHTSGVYIFLLSLLSRVHETWSTVGGTGVVMAGHVSSRHGNVQGITLFLAASSSKIVCHKVTTMGNGD